MLAAILDATGIRICIRALLFYKLRAVHGYAAIFDGCKPSKTGVFRKPCCRRGRPNAAERRDARQRRSKSDAEKAMYGLFNNVLV
jgi:hypothetical protein